MFIEQICRILSSCHRRRRRREPPRSRRSEYHVLIDEPIAEVNFFSIAIESFSVVRDAVVNAQLQNVLVGFKLFPLSPDNSHQS